MRDGALLIVVGAVVLGGTGWLVAHMGAVHPRQPAVQPVPVIATPRVEEVKPDPPPSPKATPKRASKPVIPVFSETVIVPVPESEADRTAPIAELAPTPTAAPVTAAPARFPVVEEIRWGTDKPQIKELFGDPALSAVTTNLGHDLEAYVYSRDRGQAVTVIRFEDGKVTAVTPQRPPFSPTNLQATAVSATQVNLTWTNNADDATAVLLELETTGSSARFDLGRTQTLTSTTVTNLQPNTSYTFRVRARNAVGDSAYSRPATVTLALPAHASVR